jgi:acetyltransferase-like isoleucine patch superfamily enzyme
MRTGDKPMKRPETAGLNPAALPVWGGDLIRLAIDVAVRLTCLLCAACALARFWRTDGWSGPFLALAAAVATYVLAFIVLILVFRAVFVRKVVAGTYSLRSPEALRWIMADGFYRMVLRSFLRCFVHEFAPLRHVFLRLMGAKASLDFIMGSSVNLTDPWMLEIGRGVILGAGATVCCHVIEGETVTISPVRILEGATIGIGAVVLPGVVVENRAIVAAGAVVTKDTRIPAGTVWGGVPARKIGEVAVGPGKMASAKTAAGIEAQSGNREA